MVNHNDGKWHGWNGGECPVHPETLVEIVYFEDGITHNEAICKYCDFSKDADLPIIAFRVIKEHKEPREFWIAFNQKGEAVDYGENIDELSCEDGWTCSLFREVIE